MLAPFGRWELDLRTPMGRPYRSGEGMFLLMVLQESVIAQKST